MVFCEELYSGNGTEKERPFLKTRQRSVGIVTKIVKRINTNGKKQTTDVAVLVFFSGS